MELFEIRLLVVTDPEEASDILAKIGDLVRDLVGIERFGTALFFGVNPNGTEVPEGFEVFIEGEQELPFGAEATLSASGHKTEDDEIEGAAV
jgi:hypothetical protein